MPNEKKDLKSVEGLAAYASPKMKTFAGGISIISIAISFSMIAFSVALNNARIKLDFKPSQSQIKALEIQLKVLRSNQEALLSNENEDKQTLDGIKKSLKRLEALAHPPGEK